MKKTLVVICLATMLAATSGCATIANWLHNPAVDQILESAFTVVVDLLLKNYAAPNDVVEAKKLADAATVLQGLTAGDATSVQTLAADAAAKINATDKIDPVIKSSLILLVQVAIPFVQSGQGAVPADAKFDLSTIFKYVADASNFYAQSSVQSTSTQIGAKLRITGH